MSRLSPRLLLAVVAAVAVAAAIELLPSGADPDDPPVAAPDQPPPALSSDRYWAPIFVDEFSGTAVDATRWNVGDNSNYGTGNREDQCYRAANTTVADGTLRLTGQRETVTGCGSNPDGGSSYYFTSGLVTTRQQHGTMKFKYRHGYAEVRLRAPRGNIYWPAFWLVGAADGSSPGWPAYGEVDVTEIYGSRPDISESNFHRTGGNIGARDHNVADLGTTSTLNVNPPNEFVAGATNDFHTYGVNWTADKLEWFIDGVLVRTYTATTSADVAALGYEHSFILNLAMGGNGPASHGYTGGESGGGYDDGNLVADLPGTMEVDYVKVWQPTDGPPPPPPPPPPAAELAITAPADGTYVASTSTTLTGTCVAASGDVTVALGVTGGESSTLTLPCESDAWTTSTPLPDGAYSATASQTTDTTTTSAPVAFTVDTITPTVTLDAPAPGATLLAAPVTFSGLCSSGEGPVTVRIAGGDALEPTAECTDGSWSLAIDIPDGLTSAAASQSDAAGNTGTSAFTGFLVDANGPVTTDNTATIGAEWRSGNATVVLSATDAGSGVAQTYYTVDGTEPDLTSPTGTSIELTAEGMHTVKYFSVDNSGHAEPVKTAATTIRIDRTAPQTTDDAAVIGDAWKTTAQTVTLTASDPVSGEMTTYFTTDGSDPTTESARGTSIVLSTPGTYTIKYFSVDSAGNAEAVRTAANPIRIDTTRPVTTDDASSIGSSWKSTARTVTLTPSDTGSGPATTYFTTDGSAPTTASAQGTSVPLTESGVYTIKYFSVDAAGNAEAVKTAGTTIRIDITPPVNAITFPVDGARYRSSNWASGCSSTSRICGTASDTPSGVTSVRVSVRRLTDGRYWTGSGWQTSTTSVTASGSATWSTPLSTSQLANGVSYQVVAWTVDAAGNLSLNSVRTFTYDTSGPTTSGGNLATTNKNGSVGANPTPDTFSVTFNEALDPSTVPGTATLSLSRARNNTSYGISGLTSGLRTTGTSGYLTSSSSTRTISFAGTLSLSNGNRTVTFTVTGSCSGACGAQSGTPRSGAFQFVPAPALRDLAGNAPSTSSVTAPSQVMF
jgi:beta-glucanase (GH16 family)